MSFEPYISCSWLVALPKFRELKAYHLIPGNQGRPTASLNGHGTTNRITTNAIRYIQAADESRPSFTFLLAMVMKTIAINIPTGCSIAQNLDGAFFIIALNPEF